MRICRIRRKWWRRWCGGGRKATTSCTASGPTREGETRFKLVTARLFYRLMRWLSDTDIPLDTGDFRLLDRKVVDAILAMPEKRPLPARNGQLGRLLPDRRAVPPRGPIRGHDQVSLRQDAPVRHRRDPVVLDQAAPAVHAPRLHLGRTRRCWSSLYAVVLRLFTHDWVAGWTALIVTVLFLGGAQLISLGIIGEYVGRLYGEAKRRPLVPRARAPRARLGAAPLPSARGQVMPGGRGRSVGAGASVVSLSSAA